MKQHGRERKLPPVLFSILFEEKFIQTDSFSALLSSQDIAVLIFRYPNKPIEIVFTFPPESDMPVAGSS